jgi:hypothetical protein
MFKTNVMNRRIVKRNVIDVVRELETRQTQAFFRNVKAERADEMFTDLGSQVAGEFIAPAASATSTEPTDAGFSGAGISADGRTWNGDKYLFFSSAAGALKFGVRDDGSVFSDGDYLNILNMWQSLGQAANDGATVKALCYDATNGCIYVGGEFSKIGGVTAANIIKYTLATRTFSALATGVNDYVTALALSSTGTLYVGGNFTNAGGDASADRFCKWNGTAFSAVGTGFAGIANLVSAILIDSSDDIYVGGLFTNVGDANGDYIVKISGTTYSSLATGLGAVVFALAMDSAGVLYVGGNFTNAGGDANADSFCKWNGVAFSAVGTGFAGASGAVRAIAIDSHDDIYVGGLFTDVGDANGDYIVKISGTTYSSLGTGLANSALAIAVDSQDNVYVGGSFSLAGGVAGTSVIAKWNGTAWEAMGSGFTSAPTTVLQVHCLWVDADDIVYAGGSFLRDGDEETGIVKFAKWGKIPLKELLDYILVQIGASSSILGAVLASAVATGATVYTAPYRTSLTMTAENCKFYMPRAGFLRNFRLYATSATPAAAGMVVTARKNGVDTAMAVTLTAGDAAGLYTDLTNIIYFDAGDYLTIKFVNGVTFPSNSATIESWSAEFL